MHFKRQTRLFFEANNFVFFFGLPRFYFYFIFQGDSFCVKYDPNSLLYISKVTTLLLFLLLLLLLLLSYFDCSFILFINVFFNLLREHCITCACFSFFLITKAMDLFDLGEGFSSLLEGVAQIRCPTLVSS